MDCVSTDFSVNSSSCFSLEHGQMPDTHTEIDTQTQTQLTTQILGCLPFPLSISSIFFSFFSFINYYFVAPCSSIRWLLPAFQRTIIFSFLSYHIIKPYPYISGLALWERRSSYERSCSTLSLVSTGMGDRLRAGIHLGT